MHIIIQTMTPCDLLTAQSRLNEELRFKNFANLWADNDFITVPQSL